MTQFLFITYLIKQKYVTTSFTQSTFTKSDFTVPPMDKLPTSSSQLSQIEISCTNVFEALVKLDPTKAFGYDNISPCVPKSCATPLLTAVTI